MNAKAVLTLFGLALMGAMFSPSAKADAWNRRTKITLAEAVEIPAVHQPGWGVLPAGTYVFRVMDSAADRHIVQILSPDELTVYATILAIPNLRLKPTDKTVITFHERPAGRPQALRAWFYPGRNWGEEFVYPTQQAIELARVERLPILETPSAVPFEAAKPEEPKVIEQLKEATVKAVEPSGQEVEIAQVVTPPPIAETQVTTPPAEAQLPKTASPMALIALLGLLALGGGLVVRALEIRM